MTTLIIILTLNDPLDAFIRNYFGGRRWLGLTSNIKISVLYANAA